MDKPEIIILCAAHINCPEREKEFYKMLRSQMNQSLLCHVYVSVSGLPVKFDYNFHVQKYVKIYHQPEPKLSQFTHYHRLINTLFDNGIIKPNTYILFADDDDEMHSNRNEIYYEHLCEKNTNGNKIDVLHLKDSIIRCEINNGNICEINKKDNEYVAFCVSGIVAKTLINCLIPNTVLEYTCDFTFMYLLMAWPWSNVTVYARHPVYYYKYSILLIKS